MVPAAMPDTPTPPPPPGRPRQPLAYERWPVERRLDLAQNIPVAYAGNAPFREGMNAAGTTPVLIGQLGPLVTAARRADNAQAAAYSAEGAGSARVQRTMAALEKAVKPVRARADAAGRADAELKRALDFGPKERNRSQRLAQVQQFLEAATTHQAALGGYGLEAEHLTAATTAAGAAHTASQAWDLLERAAERSTQERDLAMVPLDELVRDLQERERAGLGNDSQLLEILGLRPI